jgi:hypothetical protein
MVSVVVAALLLAAARFALRCLGPRPGGYHGVYWYFDDQWRYHEVRGCVIFVTEQGGIFVD